MHAFAKPIIEHALPHIPFDGWRMATLAQATREAGFPEGAEQLAFPAGVADALDAWAQMLDDGMAEIASTPDFTALRIPQKIEALVLARIRLMQPHREAARAASRFMLLPWHAGRAARHLFCTVNRMWECAGVADMDFNYYTRRATLAYAYAACVQYFLSDEGEDEEKLAAFLGRRLQEVAWLGKQVAKVKPLTKN